MKTIAKVVDGRTYESHMGKRIEPLYVSIIDTPIPAIIYNPDTHEYTHGEAQRIKGYFPIGTTLEIESTFYQAGEIVNGHVLSHDCYVRDTKVID